MNELRTCHLFAGAGGGLLADLILGHKPVVAVEWDAYACQVLRERAADGWFPDLRVWEGDVRLFDPSEYTGKVDCIAAGFPCTDLSVAGKQAGLGEGTRSGLYREVLRVAGIVKPRYIFMENVSAILNSGLGTVLADLAALGYDSRWCCIRASNVGAPHGRDRWWLRAVAHSNSTRVEEHGMFNASLSIGSGAPITGHKPEKSSDDVAYSNSNQRSASCMGQNSGTDGRDDISRGGEILADTESQRKRSKPTPPGKGIRFIGGSEDVADTTSQSAIGHPIGTEQAHAMFRNGGADVPSLRKSEGRGERDEIRHATSARFPKWTKREVGQPQQVAEPERSSGFTIQRQTEPRLGCMADGLAFDMVPDNEFQGWWQEEPSIGRTTQISSNRASMLKCLGNGQVPLQAATAWRLLEGAA